MKGSGCYNCPVKGCTAEYRWIQCSVLREIAGVDFDPMTNADRIRAMSDEELADMFAQFAEENPSDDAMAWLEWLQQPTQED